MSRHDRNTRPTASTPGALTPKTSLAYRVPYADTDQMGVVYYANYLVYFERSRNEVLRAGGLTYKEIEASGILLPVIQAHCDYARPAAYDDSLEIIGWFELLSPLRIRAHCEVRRDGQLLAEGHTIHVVFCAKTRKPVRFPAGVLERLFPPVTSSG